ncbi:bifunctional acetaldehyde-CoA/alcohol dehydrogenase [Candidatus Izimaplasma bacterium ZiA1]|uniref:bifunctional acetaldehyde-CoA/alcohol dehydrogenase n=1 Tax=Candidatus Izimoplasma sp. ZiA1 TaxID=2024899 RepID=UPI000BAA91F1|nr:bifunctional acetaldehyde-CoA/alcohol dehydrogenase [Candidatus Izimaplasma bacterium ZiA1]
MENNNINEMIDKLVNNAEKALEDYMELTQEQVDLIVHEMTLAGVDNHMLLAQEAIKETKRGVLEDKVIKNLFSTEYIWHSIKKQKTVGVIESNSLEDYQEVAEPIGIIAGVTPVTNPTSTTMFKALISAKTRNPIIFAFHPSAQNCSALSAKVLYDAALKAGAPKHCIQWITMPSIEATNLLMNNKLVSLILATGGSSMVKSAYSAGKPALGVGPGNVPCYIEKTANLERACTDLMLSKTFDNGMICASEQAVIVDKEIHKDFESFMKLNSCHFLNKEEIEKVTNYMFPKPLKKLNANVVGNSAYDIAKASGVTVPSHTKILLAKLTKFGDEAPISKEKLSPVLAYYIVDDAKAGFKAAKTMLEIGGLGHSAVIHSTNEDLCTEYGKEMKVGRIIVNSPSSQGAIGDIYNTNLPSLTLGCGSYGKNSTTSNVSSVNLINKKRIAARRTNMQWFKVPPKIYFEHNSIQYLEKMRDISRVFIVTDEVMEQLGYVDKALYYLRKRDIAVSVEVFSDVEPDPSLKTINDGVKEMRRFKPDCILALGGGSAIDAAKGMWLFYENEHTSFDGLKLKFLDIRKRSFPYPKLGKKAKFVAVPTTSGTGSEVTAFSVITDKENGNIKYPLADYELTPDVAIIDPQFCMTMPKSITADTGLDVLTHAIEAYISILASDYTDALALKAIELVFNYLPRAYKYGQNDKVAREKMHNASAIAGMAFTNAFLGINHSLAHKLGGEFHIPHGRANAILLPHVIKYNSQKPTKFVAFPKYEKFIADEKIYQIAKYLGLKSSTKEEAIESLIMSINNLLDEVNIPRTLKGSGIDEKDFNKNLSKLAIKAFEDQCTTTNPRYPLISELEEILKKAYK